MNFRGAYHQSYMNVYPFIYPPQIDFYNEYKRNTSVGQNINLQPIGYYQQNHITKNPSYFHMPNINSFYSSGLPQMLNFQQNCTYPQKIINHPSFEQPTQKHYQYLNYLLQEIKQDRIMVDQHWGESQQEKSIITYLAAILKKKNCISKIWECLGTIYYKIIPMEDIQVIQEIIMAKDKIQFNASKPLKNFSEDLIGLIQSQFLPQYDYLQRYHFLKAKNQFAAIILKELLFDISSVYQKSILLVCESYHISNKNIRKLEHIIEYRLNFGLVKPTNFNINDLYRIGKLLCILKKQIEFSDRLQAKVKLLFYLKISSTLIQYGTNICENCYCKNIILLFHELQKIKQISNIQKLLKTNLFNHSQQELVNDLLPLFFNDIDCVLIGKNNNVNQDLQHYLNQEHLCLECKLVINKNFKYFYVLCLMIKLILSINLQQKEEIFLLRFIQNMGNLFDIDDKVVARSLTSIKNPNTNKFGKPKKKIQRKQQNQESNKYQLEDGWNLQN